MQGSPSASSGPLPAAPADCPSADARQYGGAAPRQVPLPALGLGQSGSEHLLGEAVGRVGVHGGQHMGVDVQGHADLGVAESLGHDLDRHAGLQEQGGVGVAQVVLMPTSA
jgi:hypothetical protein